MLKNRVKQYTTTVGTGSVNLTGSYNGFATFANSFSNGDKLYYVIECGSQWEIGIGTYSSGTLTRDTLIQSSTGSKISLVGRSSVYVDLPASKYLYANDNNVVIVPTGGLKFSDNTTITSVNDIEPVWGTISGDITDQSDLVIALSGKSDVVHNHDGIYQPLDSDLTALAGINTNSYGRQVLSFSGSDELRTHASVYSSGEVDSLLSSKANNNVNIIAGSGLSGGGNLTADRTFSLSTTPVTTGTYSLATITVDQFGRITAASSGSVDLSSYATISYVDANYLPLTGGTLSGSLSVGSNSVTASAFISTVSSVTSRLITSGSTLQIDNGAGGPRTINHFGNYQFATDNTYDIGASGANRPRDGYFGRNLIVDGTITGSNLSGTNTGDQDLSGYLTTSSAATTYVPLTRTINGVDLSVDRILSIGNSGTDAAWSGLTLNIPDASASARGLITTETQTIAGTKTFSGAVSFTGVAWEGKTLFQSGYTTVGWGLSAGNWYWGSASGNWKLGLHATFGVQIFDGQLSFNGQLPGSSSDLFIARDAANILAQRNSTNAQTFNVANTYTSSTNFEYGRFQWNSNEFRIGTAIGSAGGTQRSMVLGSWNSAGTFYAAVSISSNGTTTFQTTGSADPVIIRSPSQSPWAMRIYNQTYSTSNAVFDFYPQNDGVFKMGTNVSTAFQFYTNGYTNIRASFSGPTGDLTLTPSASTSGSQTGFTFTAPASTGQTASTEATMVNWNLASTVTFATGSLTTQRAFRIQAPTYAFAGASTITDASTVSISGPPIAGTNATITNAFALNVESGAIRLNSSQSSYASSSTVLVLQSRLASPNTNIAGFSLYADGTFTGNGDITLLQSKSFIGRGVIFDGGWGEIARSSTRTNGNGNHLTSVYNIGLSTNAGFAVQLINGTNPQALQIYNTFTSSTSFENLQFQWTSNEARIGTSVGSVGGTLRTISLGSTNSAGTWRPAITIVGSNSTEDTSLPSITVSKSNSISGYISISAVGGGHFYTGDTNSVSAGVFFIGTAVNTGATVTTHRFAVDPVNNVVHIGGYRRAVAVDGLLTASYGTGTDSAGSGLCIAGGRGTGSGVGGSIKLQTAPSSSSGVSLNTLVDRLTINSAGLATFTGNVALTLAVYQTSEPVNTPSGTTQTIILNDDNHQTLDLSSATGSVTVTLTVPSGSCAGTIIVKQHGSASKGITWAVSSGSIKWLGTEPTWSSDTAGSYRVISWRWNGSIMFLMSTESGA